MAGILIFLLKSRDILKFTFLMSFADTNLRKKQVKWRLKIFFLQRPSQWNISSYFQLKLGKKILRTVTP